MAPKLFLLCLVVFHATSFAEEVALVGTSVESLGQEGQALPVPSASNGIAQGDDSATLDNIRPTRQRSSCLGYKSTPTIFLSGR